MTSTNKRLYVVKPIGKNSNPLADPKPRLIRATSQSAALRFATAGIYEVEAAGAEDVVRLYGEGVKTEDAL